jgi:hypothetical protein
MYSAREAFRSLPGKDARTVVVRALPREGHGNLQLGHRIAVGHFDRENAIVLTPRHIPADEPIIQSRDLGLEAFVSRCYSFGCFRAAARSNSESR